MTAVELLQPPDLAVSDRLLASLPPHPGIRRAVRCAQAWRAAREFYGQTEAFRFYGGLINDRAFALTKDAIAAQNERDGEENIATGWHAIEFLLWGQGLSEAGPGARPYTDFVDDLNSVALALDFASPAQGASRASMTGQSITSIDAFRSINWIDPLGIAKVRSVLRHSTPVATSL